MIVCMPNCAYLSETSRVLAIHRALVARGAEVTIATHGGAHEHVLADAGVAATRLEPVMADARGRALVAAGPGMGSPRQSFWSDDELRAAAVAERDYLRDIKATAVVTGFQLTTLLSCRMAGIPVITDHGGSYVAPVLEARLLPRQRHTGPAAFRLMPGRLGHFMTNEGPFRYKGYIGGFNRVAREFGVEPVPSLAALLSGDLTLVPEAAEVLGLDEAAVAAWRPRTRALRPSTRMRLTGPLFAELPWPIPQAVEAFLAEPGPVAYVAPTSTSPQLVRQVTAAVRAAGLRALVVSTVHDMADLGSRDVMVVPFLPSHKVMPRVDVAVTAGGQGSVQTALASGTPLVGIPLQPEQEWNVNVAVRTGAARIVGQRRVGRELTRAVADLLRDGRAKASAQRVAAIYSRYDGPALAAKAVSEYLVDPDRQPAVGPVG